MSEISNNREESRENDRGKEKEPLLRRAMDAFGTIFALNVCFVVGCIPIFTVMRVSRKSTAPLRKKF